MHDKRPHTRHRSRFDALRNYVFATAIAGTAALLPAKAQAGTPSSAGSTAGTALVTATHIIQTNSPDKNLPSQPTLKDDCTNSEFAQSVKQDLGMQITPEVDLEHNMVAFGLDGLTPPGAAGIYQAVGVGGAVVADIRGGHMRDIPVTIAVAIPGVATGFVLGGAAGDLIEGAVNEGAEKLGASPGALPISDSQALLESAACVLKEGTPPATTKNLRPQGQKSEAHSNPNFSKGRQAGPSLS